MSAQTHNPAREDDFLEERTEELTAEWMADRNTLLEVIEAHYDTWRRYYDAGDAYAFMHAIKAHHVDRCQTIAFSEAVEEQAENRSAESEYRADCAANR
jgi:hypothetical protein